MIHISAFTTLLIKSIVSSVDYDTVMIPISAFTTLLIKSTVSSVYCDTVMIHMYPLSFYVKTCVTNAFGLGIKCIFPVIEQ